MKNENKITQFKLYLSFDKELEYINKMNEKGWKLVYINWGMCYTFVKSQPNEYFTIIHAEDKRNLSSITTFASQCGYESIPHTMDGLGEILYLTGRRNEVSDDFVNDIESQIKSLSKIHKKLFTLSVCFFILLLVLITEAVVLSMLFIPSHTAIGLLIAFYIFCALYIILTSYTYILTFNFRKKIKQLKKESMIFE